MSNLSALPRDALPEFDAVWRATEQAMGYVPNSMLTMARDPELLLSFAMLSRVCFGRDTARVPFLTSLRVAWKFLLLQLRGDRQRRDEPVEKELRMLVAMACSVSAGCRYCQAHSGHGAFEAGVPKEKIGDVLRFEDSEHFTPRERAAVALAFAASRVPNGAGPKHFTQMRKYFSERQLIDVLSVIAVMGYLNRWNDTIGTELEPTPATFAARMASTSDESSAGTGRSSSH